jgi:hypothetical protein
METQDTQLVYGPFISREQAKSQGLKRFYDGVPCSHGHLSGKYVSDSRCVLCAYQRAMKTHLRRHPPTTKVCPVCGTEFTCGAGQQRTHKAYCCSDKCAQFLNNHRPGKQEKRNLCNNKSKKAEPQRWRDYQNNYYAQNPQFAITRNLRSRVGELLRNAKTVKVAKTSVLIGCSGKELMAYLQSLFAPGMSWDNYGEWHIDHIRPCASFDLTDPAQQRECFHYTNLQPLWAADNLAKSDNWGPSVAA